jgi:hypothetical protein
MKKIMTADRDRFFFCKPEVKGREKYFGGTPAKLLEKQLSNYMTE